MPGYYRRSNTSLYAAACENSDACLGSPLNIDLIYKDEYSQGLCRTGNTGTLCFYCEFDYGKAEKNDYCKECASLMALVYGRVFACMFIVVVYILLNFNFAERFDRDSKNISNFSCLFQILVNYSQQITLLFFSTEEIQLVSVKEIFSAFNYMSFSNEFVISNDCLIQKLYYERETMIIFIEIFNALLPIFFSILSFSIWIFFAYLSNFFHVFRKFKKKLPGSFDGILPKIQIFIFLSFFLFYSLIVKSFFWLFNCMSIDLDDKDMILRESPNIHCWEKKHITYVFAFGLPGLIIWGLGFPLTLFLLLRRNHKIIFEVQNVVTMKNIIINQTDSKLNEKNSKNIEINKVLVFFYKNFKQDYYFWECLIFLRKLLLTFLSSMGGSMPIEIIYFLMLLIFSISLYSTMNAYPYKLKDANKVEIFSLATCLFTIFSVYFFNSSSCSFWLKRIISIICILFNAFFLIFAVVLLVFDVMKTFRIKVKVQSKI